MSCQAGVPSRVLWECSLWNEQSSESSWYHLRNCIHNFRTLILQKYPPCCTWRVHSKKLTTSVLICVNPQAFLLWNAWTVKNWFMWTTHLTYYIKYIFQNGSLQSPWNRRAYLGLSREAKAESVIRLLSSFKHGQEGSGEGPIILKDLSGQCWERSHATQRKPEFWSIKSALLHFCSLVLTLHILLHAHHAWNHTSSIFKHTVKESPIHLPQKSSWLILREPAFHMTCPAENHSLHLQSQLQILRLIGDEIPGQRAHNHARDAL